MNDNAFPSDGVQLLWPDKCAVYKPTTCIVYNRFAVVVFLLAIWNEQNSHMTASVVAADLLIYIPAVLVYYKLCCKSKLNKVRSYYLQSWLIIWIFCASLELIFSTFNSWVIFCCQFQLWCAAVMLTYPGLILIDHGHFQYPKLIPCKFIAKPGITVFPLARIDICARI